MNERINQVITHIRQHLHEPLPVHQLAQMACLSDAQFYAVFRRQTGLSPGQMITQLRMQKAHQLLLQAPVRVQALSEECGYRNYESFSRAFKNTYGLAPDDLARVVSHIKGSHDELDGLYVMSVEPMDEKALNQLVLDWLEAHQVPAEWLPRTAVFKVSEKGPEATDQHTLIRNKYVISQADHLLTIPDEG
jgi:AraC-like DNA-binding protein